jgi:group I intron endonuclease
MIIYKTTNLINNKFYIGQDINNNPKYFGSGKLLKTAIKKYGIENFIKEIIEICIDESHMDEREIYWISKLNATNRNIAYNICEGGRSYRSMKGENNPMFGRKLSEESKELIREKRKLQKMSDEQKNILKLKWTGEGNPNFGKKLPEETIEKMKKSLKELNRVGENSTMFGKKHSEETKLKWSIQRKGKNLGTDNPDATKYYIETPDGDMIEIETRRLVMEFLGCSSSFFTRGSYKKYKLIKKEKLNR